MFNPEGAVEGKGFINFFFQIHFIKSDQSPNLKIYMCDSNPGCTFRDFSGGTSGKEPAC